MDINELDTPCAVLDLFRMDRNIKRMQEHMEELGVKFRPHAKTSKCVEVVNAQIAAGARGITVSTVKEAEAFFAAGITDILYAVCISAAKLPRILALRRRGCNVKVIVDSVPAARAVCDFGRRHNERFDVWIEVDTDGHRSGIPPAGGELLEVGRLLHGQGARVGGVLTHAGSSYELHTPEKLAGLAERERAGCVLSATRLREAGIPCEHVSVGSTPTAFAAGSLEGVTEVRAGVYVFFDLVMKNVGVCSVDDIALSVMTTVIGHQKDKGWIMVDAGWMAMSRDRGTAGQTLDYGYGLPCLPDGTPLHGFAVIGANQEHGIISRVATDAKSSTADVDIEAEFPLGCRLRILPNHACATGAQHDVLYAIDANAGVTPWQRFRGW
ncbi:DSD1 family PLP-dependent enzyme [Acerihabitans arboris]|uniref:DSD1 family PLP-dependent enzyme n=1 Tax=Acerihabitans arboris TaxID=2691583 RepID=A0A845SGB1_9GAMM|nr:DSD1 family PLP-dependent enzyme [Acerihabitans arboris]NDL62106.1 DSD1 family PLP-dependent enzyme [Acerihabitans arboris]